ncbi:MAG: flagellar export chaperone FlgN [Planctomycetota bacterium]
MTDSPPSPADPHALIALVTEQRDQYTALKSLADQQQLLIERGHAEQLLSVISKRQSVIDRLGELSRELDPHRAMLTQLSESAADETAQTLRSLVREVQDLLESIIQQDQRDTQQLQAARDQVATTIKTTNTSRAVHAAYQRQQANTNRFTNQQG